MYIYIYNIIICNLIMYTYIYIYISKHMYIYILCSVNLFLFLNERKPMNDDPGNLETAPETRRHGEFLGDAFIFTVDSPRFRSSCWFNHVKSLYFTMVPLWFTMVYLSGFCMEKNYGFCSGWPDASLSIDWFEGNIPYISWEHRKGLRLRFSLKPH